MSNIEEILKLVNPADLMNAINKVVEEQNSHTSEFDHLFEEDNTDSKYPSKKDGFFLKKEVPTKDGGMTIKMMPDYDGLSDYMMKEHHMKCDDSLVYLWKEKFFKSTSFLGLKNTIDSYIKTNTAPTTINGFYNKSLIKSYVDFNDVKEPSGFLNCNNGSLEVSSGKLLDHSPERFIKYVLDHDFDEKAECPNFMRSLNLVTNGDSDLMLLIQQVFGYCISGGHPIAHKAFMFYGEGGNGKSTILTALSNLVGQSNAARVPLTLFDKPFSMISLDGKLVNLIDETPKFNINPEAFKNVVSGGYVRAAHKGKPEVDLKMNCRVVFACNKLPNFKDDSDGMLRRLVIIPFNHRISDKDADKRIDDKIKKEMSGILNWALKGLQSLISNEYMFHYGKATKETMEQYKVETDSVYYFFTECTEFMDGFNGSDTFSTHKELYDEYKAMCTAEGLYSLSGRAFSLNAGKYYKNIYSDNGLVLCEKDRQFYGKGKGIKRIQITSNYLKSTKNYAKTPF